MGIDVEQVCTRKYSPISHSVLIGNRLYEVVIPEAADSRAKEFLSKANSLLLSNELQQQELCEKIHKYLTIAVDLGNGEAAYILSNLVLQARSTHFTEVREMALYYMKLAAERGHREACIQMAACYRGESLYPELLAAGRDYFARLKQRDKETLASYYGNLGNTSANG